MQTVNEELIKIYLHTLLLLTAQFNFSSERNFNNCSITQNKNSFYFKYVFFPKMKGLVHVR